MPIKAVVSDLATVDEVVRPFYVEKNGKFVLDVAASEGFALEDVDGLKSALVKERTNREALETKTREFETKFSAFEGLDPVAARDAITRLDKIANLDPEKEAERLADEKYKAKSTRLKQTFDEELETFRKGATEQLTIAQTALAARDAQVKSLIVDNAIAASLAKLNPVDDLRDAVELLARQSIRTKEVEGRLIVQVVNADGTARYKDVLNGIPMTVEDFLTEMRESRPSFFKADGKTGIGMGSQPNAPGGQGSKDVNPWAQGTKNLTQQSILLKNDPSKAARLMAEAGVPPRSN